MKETPESEIRGEEESLDSLERQVERGSLFTHTILSRHADRLNKLESLACGMMDVLLAKALVTEDEVLRAAEIVRNEVAASKEAVTSGVALRVDGAESVPVTPVACAERLHICKAVCCKLSFALSAPEVESGVIKWDLGEPYYIRHEPGGYCTHLDAGKKCCTIYENRPSVCKKYSCAGDTRIWRDFEKMELNQEWLDQHLADARPRLVQALMFRMDG
jgi:Fe-S-cluster containining protein